MAVRQWLLASQQVPNQPSESIKGKGNKMKEMQIHFRCVCERLVWVANDCCWSCFVCSWNSLARFAFTSLPDWLIRERCQLRRSKWCEKKEGENKANFGAILGSFFGSTFWFRFQLSAINSQASRLASRNFRLDKFSLCSRDQFDLNWMASHQFWALIDPFSVGWMHAAHNITKRAVNITNWRINRRDRIEQIQLACSRLYLALLFEPNDSGNWSNKVDVIRSSLLTRTAASKSVAGFMYWCW